MACFLAEIVSCRGPLARPDYNCNNAQSLCMEVAQKQLINEIEQTNSFHPAKKRNLGATKSN